MLLTATTSEVAAAVESFLAGHADREVPYLSLFGLDPGDVEMVACLSECTLPRAEAPGARPAAVHEYIDEALVRAEPSTQSAFEEGLAWLKDYVARSAGQPFVELDRDHQHRLLAEISDTSRAHQPKGYAFLTQIKQLTIEGYYRS